MSSLTRIVSNLFSTVLTIGHIPYLQPNLLKENADLNTILLKERKWPQEYHIHLIGADQPEVFAVESGLIQVRHYHFLIVYHLHLCIKNQEF